MPTEQMITYFHVASSDFRVRRWPTRNAVTIVVASTAAHSTPRLFASTASTIAARNSGTSTPYRRAPRRVGVPRDRARPRCRPRRPTSRSRRRAPMTMQHHRGQRVDPQPAAGGNAHRRRPSRPPYHADGRESPRPPTTVADGDGTPPAHRPPRPARRQRRDDRRRRQQRHDRHTGDVPRHQSCSSRSSSMSVPPKVSAQPRGEDLQHEHDEQHVERDTPSSTIRAHRR